MYMLDRSSDNLPRIDVTSSIIDFKLISNFETNQKNNNNKRRNQINLINIFNMNLFITCWVLENNQQNNN